MKKTAIVTGGTGGIGKAQNLEGQTEQGRCGIRAPGDPSAGAIWKFYFNSFNKDFEKEAWYPYLNFDSTIEVCGRAYPPTYIVTSVADIVHSAGVRTHKTLKKAGIPTELNDSKNPKLMHVYMVTGADLPEGQAAIDSMTGFFQKYIS